MKKSSWLKMIIAVALVTFMLVGMIPIAADSWLNDPRVKVTEDGIEYLFRGSDGLVNVCGYSGTEKNVVIPDKIEGVQVVCIGNYAFRGCDFLETITLPDSIKLISKGAFENCKSLEYIDIPKGVKTIEPDTFAYCRALKSINIPDGVETIGYCAFFGCLSAEKLVIPASVTSIGEVAFYGCESLQELVIPASVTSIDEGAFVECVNLNSIKVDEDNKFYDSRNNCNALIETATNTLINGCNNTVIPDGIETICKYAFAYCESLQEIMIPASVRSIDETSFAGCVNLKSIKVHEDNKFYDSRNNCNALIETATNTLMLGCDNTIIPVGVEKIGYAAFTGISAETFVIPDGIKTINLYSFDPDSNPKYLYIPRSVTGFETTLYYYGSYSDSLLVTAEAIELIPFTVNSEYDFTVPVVTVGDLPVVNGGDLVIQALPTVEDLTRTKEFFYEGTEEEWKQAGLDEFTWYWYSLAQVHFKSSVEDMMKASADNNEISGDTEKISEENGDSVTIIIFAGCILLIGGAVAFVLISKKKHSNLDSDCSAEQQEN